MHQIHLNSVKGLVETSNSAEEKSDFLYDVSLQNSYKFHIHVMIMQY